MITILFVCHGNICRSPMAMYVMRDIIKREGLDHRFQVDSAATSREEIGNPVYPPARRKMRAEGVAFACHAARKMVMEDYDRYDLIIGMDQENLEDMYDICEGNDPYSGGYRRRNASGKKALREIPRISRPEERRGRKISLLLDYTDRPREVADPWYTGNFDTTWRDVNEGIRGLLDFLDD